MRYLVDTHVFLWMFVDDPRLTTAARTLLQNTLDNTFFVSDVTAWETSIKYGLGKLRLPEPPEIFFYDRIQQAGYKNLRIELSHVTRVHRLNPIHGDPFDRLLISQALVEDLTIITNDAVIPRYKTDTILVKDLF